MVRSRHLCALLLLFALVLAVPVAFAQQTGNVVGKVTGVDGTPLPGVTVEAQSSVLPQARVTTTSETGEYRLPVLPPGQYQLQFSLAGMETRTRNVRVILGQDAAVNVTLGMQGVSEQITVTAESTLVDTTSAAIKSGISEDVIERLPIGQEYRDLVKLAPGIQVTDATIRGPSAGGSEQDNVYQFDGVNVTLPLFGTLAAEPSSIDIAQVSIVKGGAKATDFNRSAGFTIDSVSKSGTNEWAGEFKYQLQTDSMTGDLVSGSSLRYAEEKTWGSASFGGPILRDRLFFYASYYRPTRARENSSNLYGDVPDFDSTRNEYFGKLTFTPTARILLHASYRDSDREDDFASVAAAEAATASVGEESQQQIGILESSWVINDRSFASFTYTDYALETSAMPDLLFDNVVPTNAIGTHLDINALDQLGYFVVPRLRTGTTPADLAFNDFATPIINRYGFTQGGQKVGGGAVGGFFQVNDQDFYRKSGALSYDFTIGSSLAHDVHVGYERNELKEDLARFSNGWGQITAPGGITTCPASVASCAGQPIFYQADFQRNTAGSIGRQVITSEVETDNFEINDTIRWGDWSFNVGVMLSNDTLFGQGLKEDSSTISGFVAAPGNRYKMYEIEWSKQIQPRLGATWAYNGNDTVYFNYARYNPEANSLARAASWDRNTLGLVTRAFFDASGNLIGSEQVAASSGKLFVDDLDPRHTDEFMVGTSQQLTPGWSARAYGRYRYSTNFWEDTNNNARVAFNPPPGVPRELYIPDLAAKIAQIGSGSTYVIAELDGAFTKYYEATLESDWRAGNAYLRGSYTWSHYYGTFDQDNTSTTYDFATFIGSSNIADGAGRQMWDNKYGDLHGDRRHLGKVYGYYTLPWHASAGALALYQSGHPWEFWSFEPYKSLTTSTSDTNRYAEPAGRRKSPDHYQLDLNYTQDIPLPTSAIALQVIADLYNVFDRQTGYSPRPDVHSALFGQPRLFVPPRRVQVAVRVAF